MASRGATASSGKGRGTGGIGVMAPVSIVTVLHPEFSGWVRKIPTDPDLIRKFPGHSEWTYFDRKG